MMGEMRFNTRRWRSLSLCNALLMARDELSIWARASTECVPAAQRELSTYSGAAVLLNMKLERSVDFGPHPIDGHISHNAKIGTLGRKVSRNQKNGS